VEGRTNVTEATAKRKDVIVLTDVPLLMKETDISDKYTRMETELIDWLSAMHLTHQEPTNVVQHRNILLARGTANELGGTLMYWSACFRYDGQNWELIDVSALPWPVEQEEKA